MRNVRNLVERPQNIYAEPVEVSILSPSKYTKKNLRNLLKKNYQLSTAKQSRELAFAVGEAGANFASKFESEAAIINYQLSTINYQLSLYCRLLAIVDVDALGGGLAVEPNSAEGVPLTIGH